MKFRYSARTQTGELQVGYVEGGSREAATSVLVGHNLYVLSVEKIEPPKWYHSLFYFFERVKRKDLAIFTRQFATMLQAKISIHDSLNALYYQTTNASLREAIFQISTDIDSGITLSQALEKQGHIFFEFYVNLIQSAEVTGQVEESMGFLADFLEKEMVLVDKVRNALIYPVFVIVMAVVVGGILIGLVFPQITPLFSEANFTLPVITKIFLSLGTFLSEWWFWIIVFFAAFVIVLLDYFRSKEGRAVFDQLALTTMFIGSLFKKLYVARFSEIASVLIKGGIPIAQALEISGHTLGSALYREMLHEVAEAVRRGELMSQAFSRYEKYFPPIVHQMITVGEQTGKVDEMFVRISAFYTREVENIVNNLVELIQPALMVFIGVAVGLLFAAILLPIYNLVQVIQ
jgi:type IV pilus assembly protein PilC